MKGNAKGRGNKSILRKLAARQQCSDTTHGTCVVICPLETRVKASEDAKAIAKSKVRYDTGCAKA